MAPISTLIFMAAAVKSHFPATLNVMGGCGRISGYETMSAPLTTTDDFSHFVETQVKRDTDPTASKDAELLSQAQAINNKLKVLVEDLGTFGPFTLKQTIIRDYFSLADGFSGKSARVLWYEFKDQPKPLYSLVSCSFRQPEFVYQSTPHGNFIVDKSMVDYASPGLPPLYWKLTADTIKRSSIDTILSETARQIEKKHKITVLLASGFDLKKLRYEARGQTSQDCAACATGPKVVINLKPSKQDFVIKSYQVH